MCSLDHKVLMTLKLDRWHDETVSDGELRRYPRASPVYPTRSKRKPSLRTTLMQALASCMSFSGN